MSWNCALRTYGARATVDMRRRVVLSSARSSPAQRQQQAGGLRYPQQELSRTLSATPATLGAAPNSGGKDWATSGSSNASSIQAGNTAAGDGAGAPSATAGRDGGGVATQEKSGGGDELWVVGRMLQGLDERLGAKQETARLNEMGVIDRYGALISTLDGNLEAREGDDFLVWLGSQKLSPASNGEGQNGSTSRNNTNSTGKDGDCAVERARVERFLTDAGARLNALVAHKEDMLFRDRADGEKRGKEEEGADKNAKRTEGAATTAAAAVEGAVTVPNFPEEELYQIRLTAHRAMLCSCLSLISSSLEKQQLKPGLTVDEAAAAARAMYLASPEDRLEALFRLFDTHGDGHLDATSVERVVDTAVIPMTMAAERCFAAAARAALDKKAGSAMPRTMKYTLWDVLEVPVKRRCAFAWAEDRKQVGPDEWRVSWEQFSPSRRQHFPEFEAVTSNYLKEYRKRRSEWHNTRKGRKRAAIDGTALFFGVVLADNLLHIV